MWADVESGEAPRLLYGDYAPGRARSGPCPAGRLTASVLAAAPRGAGDGEPSIVAAVWSPLELPLGFPEIVDEGFPLFGAVQRLAQAAPAVKGAARLLGCSDRHAREFHAQLTAHLGSSARSPLPWAATLDYLGTASRQRTCPVGRAAALLVLAHTSVVEAGGAPLPDEARAFLRRAEELLREHLSSSAAGRAEPGGLEWPVWAQLHRLMQERRGAQRGPASPGGCLIMVYAHPTQEIASDVKKALGTLERNFVQALGVRYPLVVFTDAETAPTLAERLRPFTSAPVVPAVIPEEEMTRPMRSYSCFGGVHCEAGREFSKDLHRGVVNKTQFWSPDYLRISRYTAGPLFLHPALDRCGAFLKVDTDFFFTKPAEADPIEIMEREGTQLAYWQIHVQGQRQTGYMDAAVEFTEQRKLRVRSPGFYARGRFEEKAKKLGISLEEVPEAQESASVIYGCLFGGSVGFFREPLYQDFFAHMDRKRGFETHGWSNQFFLGTAAASFVYPSQIRRLYLSGRHQESHIEVHNGSVTEFLNGSTSRVFR